MTRLIGWQDMKQQTLLLVLFNFCNKHAAWNKQGFSNLNNLSSAQHKHSSQTRMPCYLQLTLFGKQQRVDLLHDAQCRNDVTTHNEQVK